MTLPTYHRSRQPHTPSSTRLRCTRRVRSSCSGNSGRSTSLTCVTSCAPMRWQRRRRRRPLGATSSRKRSSPRLEVRPGRACLDELIAVRLARLSRTNRAPVSLFFVPGGSHATEFALEVYFEESRVCLVGQVGGEQQIAAVDAIFEEVRRAPSGISRPIADRAPTAFQHGHQSRNTRQTHTRLKSRTATAAQAKPALLRVR